ncbi:MAG: thioredoxin domain-containing protein [Pseudomonadota bacterium]
MPNRLATSTSPYLLQHADNPVDWWTWGDAAFEAAKASDKPVLLSVGYAACHWCHVMAHESFEHPDTAEVMNRLFVNIKLDREERPDIDAIYMSALHTLGEQGGWPLTMFLTPDRRPFFGGTYFPNAERYGRPSFKRVLNEIARIYREEPHKVATNAELITTQLRGKTSEVDTTSVALPEPERLRGLLRQILDHTDAEHGGLRGAPKFPQFPLQWFIWRAGLAFGEPEALDAVRLTLERICNGGIYDHLGGGFARYTVDERWLVPHFEKMLYDNAQLLVLLCAAVREFGDTLFAARIAETIDWLVREMRLPDGGFASSIDADSEGEEGRFYVWSRAEIVEVLGAEDAELFAEAYDVSEEGNWEGKNILNRLHMTANDPGGHRAQLASMREKLLARRDTRERPGLDDKVLADWNGLLIVGLADAAHLFNRADWLTLARDAYGFVQREMASDRRLTHAWRGHASGIPGLASDYAAMAWAALSLHEVTGTSSYLADARGFADVLDAHFEDERGGYALSPDDGEELIVRRATGHDDATPNPNAVMIGVLSRLFQITGELAYRDRADGLLATFAADFAANPIGHTGIATGMLDAAAPLMVTVGGEEGAAKDALLEVLKRLSLAGATVLSAESDDGEVPPALADAARDSQAASAFVCTAGQCSMPLADAAAFEDMLREARAPFAIPAT